MKFRFASVLVTLVCCCAAVPSYAQYAYTNTGITKDSKVLADTEEEGPAAGTYKVIHGVVQDKIGVLPGATVALSGTHTIVVTNAAGEFELRVPAETKEVVLTCGYGGLQEEVVRFAPSQALGSIYLLHTRNK